MMATHAHLTVIAVYEVTCPYCDHVMKIPIEAITPVIVCTNCYKDIEVKFRDPY